MLFLNEVFMKRSFSITFALLSIFFALLPGYSKEGFYGSTGGKVIFSRDENVSQRYYKPFVSIGWAEGVIDLSMSYYRLISYAITDYNFNEKEVNINQPEFFLSLDLGEIATISGTYSYLSGDSSYSANKYGGDISFDFDSFTLLASATFQNTNYSFNGDVKNSYRSLYGELSHDFTDSFSCDVSYLYEKTDYKSFGYEYSKQTARVGLVAVPRDNLYFIGGISGEVDSDKIKSSSIDVGFIFKLFEHIKITASYMLTADFVSSSSDTSTYGGKRGGGSTGSSTTEINYFHTGSIGLSLYF
jgi:hypothetical protein